MDIISIIIGYLFGELIFKPKKKDSAKSSSK